MKPAGPIARRGDYRVEPCPHRLAAELVAGAHYARGASKVSVHAHCLVRVLDNRVVGAALWLPPTKVAAESIAGEEWRGVLGLSRLAVVEGEPSNATSLFLAASMRLVGQDPRWHTFLTYADTRQGHTGSIYRATNWDYLGLAKGRPAWIDPQTGRQVALKATRSRTVAEMRERGYQQLPPSDKHKFVYRPR